jgi:hypothetical protein
MDVKRIFLLQLFLIVENQFICLAHPSYISVYGYSILYVGCQDSFGQSFFSVHS